MGDVKKITRHEAQALGQRMQGLAATQAEIVHDFLVTLAEFDEREAIKHFHGIKSSAHFVAWACSTSAGTAREHVRVARALRDLPKVSELMAQGRLSYSKVRELTRVTGHLDEHALCELALEMTASQLARTVTAYRTAAGTRIQQQTKRRLTITPTPDGMTRITIVLPAEQAAIITAAIEAAARRNQNPNAPSASPLEPSSPLEPGNRTQTGRHPENVPAGTPAHTPAAAAQHQDADVTKPLGDPASPGAAASPNTTENTLPTQPALENVPARTRRRPLTPPDRAQAICDIAANYLDTLPGEPADDHTLVIVHVHATQLLNLTPDQGTPDQRIPGQGTPGQGTPDQEIHDHGTPDQGTLDQEIPDQEIHDHGAPDPGVPARHDTSTPSNTNNSHQQHNPLDELTCHIEGHGPIEPATAQRLTCTATLLGVLLQPDGDVLRLGRTRRLATRAQRRALRTRDHNTCQFPGCTQTSHLEAHHLTPWSTGGTTDLDTLILLCRHHHIHVHEGGVQITRQPVPWQRFHFALPNQQPITGTWLAQTSPHALDHLLTNPRNRTPNNNTKGGDHNTNQDDHTNNDNRTNTDPTRIFPPHAGAGFNLHECVRVLFNIQQPDLTTAA